MKRVVLVVTAVTAVGLAGCDQVVWDNPNGSPDQFTIDNARCTMYAQNQDPIDAVDGTNKGLAVATVLLQAGNRQQDYKTCMNSLGYIQHREQE
jgi:hypothetical protein